MQTLAVYDMLANALAERIQKSNKSTKEAYETSLKEAISDFLEAAKALRDSYPLLAPFSLQGENQIELSMGTISKKANQCMVIPPVFTGSSFHKVIQRNKIEFPQFIDFTFKPHVLIKPYNDQGWEEFAVKMMKQIIIGSLLSLPKGDIRVNFINPSLSNKSSFFSKELPSEICRVFIDRKEIISFTDSLKERIKETLRKGCKPKEPAYELIVLLDYPYQFDSLTEDMRILIEQGQQAGIHFIVLNDLRHVFENKQSFDILTIKDQYFQEVEGFYTANEKDYDNTLLRTYQICDYPVLLKAYLDYLNIDTVSTEQEEHNLEDEKGYAVVSNGLNVPIGKPIDKKTMEFCLGQDGHVHSFIIGQSGSGKSVLLHDIITEAITKYSPRDLQLYLLDCKLGGVEFNRYKDIKHTRALLVDNSDIQIILEILRDLREQMEERGKILRSAGVQKIDDFNKNHPDNTLPRIWVVIDECHVLFEQHNQSDRRARTEIVDIISKIATEGRSQGVHLIMATQTLANAEIPTAILNNITDRYVLQCAAIDAEKMWTNCSRQTIGLRVGDVLYHNTTGSFPDTQFHSTYYSQEDSIILIENAVNKASGYESNGQFYFDGSQIFQFDEECMNVVSTSKRDDIKACVGKSISLRQAPVTITLKRELSENILIAGIDEKEQSTRTAIDVLCSLIACNKSREQKYNICVFNYSPNEESPCLRILNQLDESGAISIVPKKNQGALLKQLVDNINNEKETPTILIILGQQRFRELKLDVEIEPEEKVADSPFGKMGFKTQSSQKVKTFRDALRYILDNGPDLSIHTVLLLDKPSNLLFEEYVTSKYLFRKFRHLILLRSDDKVSSILGLPDEVRPESLNSENERLRALYYADGDERWTLFSPFAFPDESVLTSLTKQI